MLTKAKDIICNDIQKTRIENDLDILYGNIMVNLGYILTLIGLNKDYIDNKLNTGELTQTDLDVALMELIATIKEYED